MLLNGSVASQYVRGVEAEGKWWACLLCTCPLCLPMPLLAEDTQGMQEVVGMGYTPN